MVQVTATVEMIGPRAAQLYVKVPRFVTVDLKDLPFGIQKGDQVELVLRRLDGQQKGLEKEA